MALTQKIILNPNTKYFIIQLTSVRSFLRFPAILLIVMVNIVNSFRDAAVIALSDGFHP